MPLKAESYYVGMSERWNAFNAAARNGHFMFDRRFMEYHADRFQDASLVFSDDEGLAGLLPANRVGDAVHTHQGLTFGGLVVDTARTPGVMAMLDLAVEKWRAQGAKKLVYKPTPYIYHKRPSDEALYWLKRAGAELYRRDVSSTISCASPGPVSSRRRRGVGKAQKAGLVFQKSDQWAEFWAVLSAVLAERHGAKPVHSVEEITRLAAALPENIELHVALQGEDVVSGVVMFNNAPVWHAQYIATSPAGRNIGALDGLFGYLIESFRGRGGYFDFGISTEEQGMVLNEGLITHKEEFGASATVYDFYELDFT